MNVQRAFCLLLAASCAACDSDRAPAAGGKPGEGSGEKPADRSYRIAVIPKGTTHEFWKSIHAGAVKAEREINATSSKPRVQVDWKGPQTESDRAQQIQVVQNFIALGVDGIVLAPLDDAALLKPVQDAMSVKIPVVVFDSGL
ncbi:MAG: substrate-binding domain-containing protein [Planctomycetes bacterium]|nr:substrate-binding domain-containing protein [Planctomycetota bacterium]